MTDFLFLCRHCSCPLTLLIGDPSRRYCVRCMEAMSPCRVVGCEDRVSERSATRLCIAHRLQEADGRRVNTSCRNRDYRNTRTA